MPETIFRITSADNCLFFSFSFLVYFHHHRAKRASGEKNLMIRVNFCKLEIDKIKKKIRRILLLNKIEREISCFLKHLAISGKSIKSCMASFSPLTTTTTTTTIKSIVKFYPCLSRIIIIIFVLCFWKESEFLEIL